jgi:hypothetical protein
MFFRAPDFFGSLAASRHLGSNWVLRQADLKKLLRFMEIFFQMELHKTTDAIAKIDVVAIAKRHDVHETLPVLNLVAVTAVLCGRKAMYIERMMERLSTDVQGTLKLVLEETMASLVDLEEETTKQNDTTEPSENLSAEDIETAGLISVDVKKYVRERQERDRHIRQLEAALDERDQSLDKLRAENAALQEKQSLPDSEATSAARDQSLDNLKTENAALREKLHEHAIKIEELTSDNVKLADELDILLPQVQQLYRAQAETSAYKKHIEDLSYEKSQQSPSGSARELSLTMGTATTCLSLSFPVSDDDTNLFPCFEDSDNEASMNPFSLDVSANEQNAVIPDDVDELATLDQLKCQMELLLDSHRLKASENERLLHEQEKLSTYVKRAVARYQDQYLAAKQDLSKSQKQIKEQQQLIGMLQRRIERQPSSSSTRRKQNKLHLMMKAKGQAYGLGAC